jgi:hypothetical protein
MKTNVFETLGKVDITVSDKDHITEVASNIIYDLSKETFNAIVKLKSEKDKERLFARRNILLVGDFRSGSSFTGKVLNKYPASFFSYEPLQYSWNFYSGLKY